MPPGYMQNATLMQRIQDHERRIATLETAPRTQTMAAPAPMRALAPMSAETVDAPDVSASVLYLDQTAWSLSTNSGVQRLVSPSSGLWLLESDPYGVGIDGPNLRFSDQRIGEDWVRYFQPVEEGWYQLTASLQIEFPLAKAPASVTLRLHGVPAFAGGFGTFPVLKTGPETAGVSVWTPTSVYRQFTLSSDYLSVSLEWPVPDAGPLVNADLRVPGQPEPGRFECSLKIMRVA